MNVPVCARMVPCDELASHLRPILTLPVQGVVPGYTVAPTRKKWLLKMHDIQQVSCAVIYSILINQVCCYSCSKHTYFYTTLVCKRLTFQLATRKITTTIKTENSITESCCHSNSGSLLLLVSDVFALLSKTHARVNRHRTPAVCPERFYLGYTTRPMFQYYFIKNFRIDI